ncbi:hypothetical protein B0T14DRAFT_566301 [Immersiella caudata]|uniref:Uncharacterized protein n=1 Tax=Immersiella caudata TaxID=314043 RepID=A0AA39WQ57_9PEZI|nr:hypothetical protein B0T14DRAFT_566301 [Immersiella caudata]
MSALHGSSLPSVSWPSIDCLEDIFCLEPPWQATPSLCRPLAEFYARGDDAAPSRAGRMYTRILPDCKIATKLTFKFVEGRREPDHPESKKCANKDCERDWVLMGQEWPNRITPCDSCSTEHCASVQVIDGLGKVIALTVWKNLGGINPGDHTEWADHRFKADTRRDDAPSWNGLESKRCSAGHGDTLLRKGTAKIRRAFDKSPIVELDNHLRYRAVIDEEVLAALTGETNVEEETRYEAGPDWGLYGE